MGSLARLLVTTLLMTTIGCAPAPATICPEPVAAAAPAPGPAPVEPAATAVTASSTAAEVVQWINAGDGEGLFARFSRDMQQAVPLAQVEPMFASLVAARGRITGVAPIEAGERSGRFRLIAERGEWELQVNLDEQGKIAGMLVREPEDSAPPLVRSAPLGLPFRGEWLVFWGGDRKELNHHIDHPSQRRAADLVVVDAAGKSHKGDGRALTDYYAYGQDILAMADGVVVTVIDGVPDSPIGELNPYMAPGNMVVIRHEGEVHSAYAHLLPGSIKVKPGSKVRRGQLLGACGNSGNSSEPHLHVQLQDGPRFEKSWGVEAVFAEAIVTRDGAAAPRKDYTFLKGDKVGAPAKGKK
ncbi:peptidoglycan DD-metalloendopeptidase family protein [Nannocystis bainbridge]|uniref:Peptidoglycan DD-metalloendopeptidase family protein n=1 Tax=Nannocystis bainbridge TaxID=2995303 RepID=A0ABT5EDW4_9BACT|nr:peptidoglycan DD-metalloendopeptidase family protein [Nannocystis bainbridge]MDC0723750.1 peptidoglycan DD-metalloendopeptidase family protein [Nannocystis bainbridge]